MTTKPAFLQQLKTFSKQIEDVLEHILPPPATRLHEAMRYSVLGGGKRLRSFFVWAASQLYDVEPTQALKAAAALELIQSYSLVHDDLPCMDNADMRRGKPSCHKVFGEATATLVGDALIPLAFETLSSLDVTPQIRLELIESLAHTIGSTGLVAGQMRDLDQEEWPRTFMGLVELQYLKTGILFGFAMEAGAILGSASVTERNSLKAYGILFGQAFQMKDDWLDGHGDEATLGKPAGQDAEKFTFLTLLGPDLLHERAENSITEAIRELHSFGERAAPLREAALYVMTQGK
ncbi:MAG: polyprenyl synthetase family protein [Alphaproteobacteria bacterium]|nr:polyprenyl synthetase family protein [Alphaproteobacteria bacterium]